MVQEYTSTQHTLRALTWPEASPDDLAGLVGSENVSVVSKRVVQVRNNDDEWVTLQDGWTIGVTGDGKRAILSPSSFMFQYQQKR